MKTAVLSLGGSLIVPDDIDTNFLIRFKKIIMNFVNKGNRVIIVCGGGKTCRKYNDAARKIIKPSNVELDRLGVKATELNAELVRIIFGKYAFSKVEPDYNKKNIKFRILLSCGFLTGTSSDYGAVMWAKNYHADFLVNLSNVDYVYDKDPRKFADAKKLPKLSWKEMQKIVGTKWVAGSQILFDPIATKIAGKLKLKVVFLNGKKLNNLENFFNGKEFVGSVVS